MEKVLKTEINGKEFSISTGKVAKQAGGSALVQYGETIVLVTAVASKNPKLDATFLPLTVEYQERIYSAGRIPGNYFRREIGRPSEKETLTSRLIDRPIRPLFPEGYNFETQVIATVYSMDKENEPDILAMVGASTALQISDIPFEGPIAGIRVGRIDGEFVANPTIKQIEESDINLVVAGSKTGIIMVEGGAETVSEEDMIDAIYFGHTAMQPIIEMQEELKKALGKEKRIIVAPEVDQDLFAKITELVREKIHTAVQVKDKMERGKALGLVKEELLEAISEDFPEREKEIKGLFKNLVSGVSRNIVLEEGKRIDGRAFDEIRHIACEVGNLPRPHGSALFTRGETQVQGVLTLGSGLDEQRVETLNGQTMRQFLLHYNFPPFSVGECRRSGGPSRRDIGHGNLAHRALEQVIPESEDFEYTIRLVGEVLESNGSSSMGTVCAGTLAMMDGGVPIKAPVSGIAMGLIKEGEKMIVLSDILGDEDHFGDMDFKVAGPQGGITALQMDIKIKELPKEVMVKALHQAKAGRLHILDKMLEALDTARTDISPYAPKIVRLEVKKDKIREIIGPGGKMIRQIQADTNTTIEINDDGIVKIAGENDDEVQAAVKTVSDIAVDPEPGEIFDGKVVKIADFGAFVNIKTGTDGLVHISELAHKRVNKVTDVVTEGQTLKVKVLAVSRDGKIKLSHKALLDKE